MTRRALLGAVGAAVFPMARSETVLVPVPARPAGATGVIASPFQFALTGSENLRVSVATSQPGVIVAIQGRRLTPDGSISPFTFTITPTSDRTVNTQDFALAGGALLTLTVFAIAGAPVRGQCFCQVQVIQGFGGATLALGTLLQGYVTSFNQLAYPGSPIESSVDGRGNLAFHTEPNPPAGLGKTVTAPTGVRWRMQSVLCTITTDAAATARGPFLQFLIRGIIAGRYPVGTRLAPSHTSLITWSALGAGQQVNNQAQTTWSYATSFGPDIYLRAADQFVLTAYDLDAGDQYSDICYVVEEWLELN